jgi:hypothetical protein
LLWGGDAGFRWAESKRNQIEKARESQTSLIDRKLSIDFEEKKDGGVAMKKINKSKIVEHAEIHDEEVTVMAWSCDGMEHDNCEQQEDGSWMCDGMQHSNCEKVEDMKYPKDEEDMSGHEDEEKMSGHDDEEKMSGHDDEEKMSGHEDEEDMAGHDEEDEEDEEEMKSAKFMRTPYDEIQDGVVKQFREAMGDNMYIVQWSFFDDMVAFYNGEDGKYYRSDFVMNNETEVITFGEPVIVKPRYLTEAEIDQLFPEQEDRGGRAENATNASAEDSAKQEGILFSESRVKELEKDLAELQAFRKEDKLKLAATFEDLVDKDIYQSILTKVDEFTKEELETKLSVEAMKRIKADKKVEKAQTINPVKFYTGQQNTNSNVNPVASLIDQWKDKK